MMRTDFVSIFSNGFEGAAVRMAYTVAARQLENIELLGLFEFSAIDSLEVMEAWQGDRCINPEQDALKQKLDAFEHTGEIPVLEASLKLQDALASQLLSVESMHSWPRVRESIRRSLAEQKTPLSLMAIAQGIDVAEGAVSGGNFLSVKRPGSSSSYRATLSRWKG